MFLSLECGNDLVGGKYNRTFIRRAREQFGNHSPLLETGLQEMEQTHSVLCALIGESTVNSRLLALPTIARGLDYYTGIIYEAITEHSGPPSEN